MNKKILIIDDDLLVLQTVVNLLKRQGFEVDIAKNGEEGLQKSSAKDYDLIISDVRMPGMDGISVVEKIQETLKAKKKQCNFMFITGYAEEDAPQHAVRLGVTDYMLKPFDMQQFLELVEKNTAKETKETVLNLELHYDPKGRWTYPDREFVYEKMVTLKETNAEGNVYFANYISWQGETREAMLLSHQNFANEFKKCQYVKMVTHSTYQRFVQEATFGSSVQIKMTTREVKKCSFVLVFRFFNKQNGLFMGEGWQRIAFVDLRSGKICVIPHYILDLILPISELEGAKNAAVSV